MKKILEIIKKNEKIFIAIGCLGLLLHLWFFQSINSIMLVPFMLYWLFLGFFYKLNEKYFFGIALFFLVLTVPFFLLGQFALAEKMSVWEFLFLIMGLLVWGIRELPLPRRKKK